MDRYAKRILWHTPTTPICTLHEDGIVTFDSSPEITEDVLKTTIAHLVKECEEKRQRILNAITKRDREWEG
jgi:hypothetical protein